MITKKEYFRIHNLMRKKKGKRKTCAICKKVKKLTLANISGKYKEDVKDWLWLCYQCHFHYDKREANLYKGIIWSKERIGKTNEEIFGKKKAKEISDKIRNKKLGKKLSDKHKAKLKGIKKQYVSDRNKANKGKTYEEIFGKKKAKKIKEKMKQTTKNQKRNKGKFI